MIGFQRLGEDVCSFEPDDETADAVLLRLYDSLAAVEIGRHVADVAPVRFGGDAASTLRFAVAAARATEADDIHVSSCATIGGVVVPAAVLTAPDGETLVAAVAAGYDAMARLALAVDGASCVYHGVWTSLLCAPVGVAAAVARALRLDEAATSAAIALAASRAVATAPDAGGGVPPRWWAIGAAAADGLLAAHAAAAGVTADAATVRFPVDVDDARLAPPLDRSAVLDVDTKAFPSARQTLPAVVAAVEAAAGESAELIERIALGVPAQVLEMVDRSVPSSNRLDSLVDVRYQVALALSQPDALFDALRQPPPAPPALTARIDVSADPELTAAFPALGGRAVVTTPAGKRAVVIRVSQPFGWVEIEDKWDRIAAASGCPGARLHAIRAAAAAAAPAALARLLIDGT